MMDPNLHLAIFGLLAIIVYVFAVRWGVPIVFVKRTMLKNLEAHPRPQLCERPSEDIFNSEVFGRYASELRQNGFSMIAKAEGRHSAAGLQIYGYSELYGSPAQRAFAVVVQVVVPARQDKSTGPSLTLATYLADGRVLITTNSRAKNTSRLFNLPTHILVRNPEASTTRLVDAHGKNLAEVLATLQAGVSQDMTWTFWRERAEKEHAMREQRTRAANPFWMAWQYRRPVEQQVIWPGDCGIPPNKFVLP